jgi:hypothetical protein
MYILPLRRKKDFYFFCLYGEKRPYEPYAVKVMCWHREEEHAGWDKDSALSESL